MGKSEFLAYEMGLEKTMEVIMYCLRRMMIAIH